MAALCAWPTNHDLLSTGRRVAPIRICSLPIGTGVSRQTPSGADTEVRPPAPLPLDPSGGCAWMDAQRTGAGPIQGCFLPSGTGVSRRMPSGRTQRSALPSRDCRVHSNGGLGLDAQRLRTSEFDSATAHSVRSTSCGPEGAQEGSRGFRDSGTPGQPSPTQPEPRQGFQRARHNALLPSSAPQQAAPAASVQ